MLGGGGVSGGLTRTWAGLRRRHMQPCWSVLCGNSSWSAGSARCPPTMLCRSPMSFFDTTPLGRILNRFSKDQTTVDETLSATFTSFFTDVMSLASTLFIIVLSTPISVVLLVPLRKTWPHRGLAAAWLTTSLTTIAVCVYIYIQRYFIAGSRSLKRLASVSRSPIYAHFQETLDGVSTIRAYGQSHRFFLTNVQHLDVFTNADYARLVTR